MIGSLWVRQIRQRGTTHNIGRATFSITATFLCECIISCLSDAFIQSDSPKRDGVNLQEGWLGE